MRYTAAFKLTGPLAAAVTVEWTDVNAPLASGAGWEACVKLPDGDWRFSSHAIVPGEAACWRDPGLFDNIGLRYRLAATSPWSPVSASRKEIILVAALEDVPPPALTAAQWSAPDSLDLGAGLFTAAFTLSEAPAGAEAVQWTTAGDPAAQAGAWQACLALDAGRWRLDSADGTHKCLEGESLDNIGLRYRLAAGGAWSPVSEDRKTLSVPRILIPPLAVSAPVLTGAGKIGMAVMLDAGVWIGTPTPSLARQWRRGGVDIPGAVLASYTPDAADDRTDLSCLVTVSSLAGTAEALAGPIRITHVAPVAAGNLSEEIFDQGSGVRTIATAGDFTGAALSFAVTGAAAGIDAATGAVSIPTDIALSGETVTVTASNSGGSAASSFLVTIEAAEVELPPALTVAEWEVEAVADPLLAGNPLVGMIRVLSGPALEATRLYRTSLNPTDGYYPGNGFEVCVRHPDTANYANCWLWRSNGAADTFHLLGGKIGNTLQTVVRYTTDPTSVLEREAVYSLDSDRKSWVVTGVPVFTAQPTLSGTGRINSPVTFNTGTATGTPTKLKSWYLNGVAISGLTAGSYTPVSADLGKALTGREVATNAAGSTTSNFTNTITIIAATEDIVTVSSMAALESAMIAAPGGRIIEVMPGNYDGSISRSTATTKSPRITVRPQDRANPPVFRDTGFNLSNWNGLILDGLSFIDRRRDSFGYPSGKSLQLLNCSNVKIIDCLFREGHEALRCDDTTNFEIAYCTFRRCGMDNIRVYAGQNNLWIHHVKIYDTWVDESRVGESDRHPDGIQFAVNGTNTPPDGVLVEDCFIENLQTGHSMHGVFFGSNATRAVANGGLGKSLAESGYRNVTVRRNYFNLGHVQGIYFEGMTDGVAEQNLMRTIPGVTNNADKPTVYLNWEKFVNIDTVNNVTPRAFYMSDAPAAQISQTGNVVSTTAVPTGWAATDVGLTLANPGAPRVGQYAAR